MPRPRLKIGEHGDITIRIAGEKTFRALTLIRDTDGRTRQVTATGPSKGAAKRALEAKLKARRTPVAVGVSPNMSVGELAAYWLEHRRTHGKARGRGAIAPQTLAAYSDAINGVILPAMQHLRIGEIRVGQIDTILGQIETGTDGKTARDGSPGRSTLQARSVLNQMFDLALRHGAMASNPMTLVEPTVRLVRRDVDHLTIDQVHLLRRVVDREYVRVPGRRMPNYDLQEWVDVALGTGCRDGEILAIRWMDLELDTQFPTVHVCGTIVEPRGEFVKHLHRQPTTKGRVDRTLLLPDHVAGVFRTRLLRAQDGTAPGPEDPVFASGTGHWLSPANIRARLRRAVAEVDELRGTSPHTVRRTVGTMIAHEVGLDAARDQLGHSDASVTFQHYVGKRRLAPDVRVVLDRFFAVGSCSSP